MPNASFASSRNPAGNRRSARRSAGRQESLDELVARLSPWESWEDFAARAGVSSRRIRQLRAADGVRPPYRVTVDRLAAALKVTAETVFRAIDETRRRAARANRAD